MKRAAALSLVLAVLANPPPAAQNAVGLDGVISAQRGNSLRQENAFGLGLTYTWDIVALVPGFMHFKLYGGADLEIVTGELNEGVTRPRHPVTGDYNFYKAGDDFWIDPTKAEAPPSLRLFWSVYPVLDIRRIRLGYTPFTQHVDWSDRQGSFLVGFAMTPVSWIMWERPVHGGWRIRIEGSIWANPLATF